MCAEILSFLFLFLIYYKVSMLRGFGILLKRKNELMGYISVCLPFIRGRLVSVSSFGSHVCTVINVQSAAYIVLFLCKMPIDGVCIRESDTSRFCRSSALVSAALGKAFIFKNSGNIQARLSLKNVLELDWFSVQKPYTLTIAVLISISRLALE